jgi:hypothetical protein
MHLGNTKLLLTRTSEDGVKKMGNQETRKWEISNKGAFATEIRSPLVL